MARIPTKGEKMRGGRTNFKTVILSVLALVLTQPTGAQGGWKQIAGTVLDPGGRAVAGAHVELDSSSGARFMGIAGGDGGFTIALPEWGSYTLRLESAGFEPETRSVDLSAGTARLTVRLTKVSSAVEEVVVNGDVSEIAIDAPDPSQKVLVREQLLDANPGRPGAPISIPGLPIETAAGGIKAPQYFAPGVMADHGEPIGHSHENRHIHHHQEIQRH